MQSTSYRTCHLENYLVSVIITRLFSIIITITLVFITRKLAENILCPVQVIVTTDRTNQNTSLTEDRTKITLLLQRVKKLGFTAKITIYLNGTMTLYGLISSAIVEMMLESAIHTIHVINFVSTICD